MKLSCAQCQQIVDVPPGQSPPPWCAGCGADFKSPGALGEARETQLNATQFAAEVLGLPQNSPRLRRCPNCKVGMPGQPGDPLPPWCPKCGADVKADTRLENTVPLQGGEGGRRRDEAGIQQSSTQAGSSAPEEERTTSGCATNFVPTVPASELLPDANDQFNGHYDARLMTGCHDCVSNAKRVTGELNTGCNDDLGRDDRFALHNLVVGAGLGIWGFIMASGMGPSADQDILNSHGTLMTAIDVLQAVTLLNGVLLVISGAGLRRRQRWAYRLAAMSAGISVLAGVMFLATWQFLMQASRGGEVVEAVATMTFVRTNLDLLIGLLDGGGLLMLLWRRPTHSIATKESRSAWASAY